MTHPTSTFFQQRYPPQPTAPTADERAQLRRSPGPARFRTPRISAELADYLRVADQLRLLSACGRATLTDRAHVAEAWAACCRPPAVARRRPRRSR